MLNNRIYIVVVILAFTIISILTLSKKSAFADEFGTIATASISNPVNLVTFLSHKDPHPPTHYLLLHYLGKLFGYSDFVMRIPSLIFIILTQILIYRLIDYLIVDLTSKNKTILFLLIITSPIFIATSITARYYSMSLFFTLYAYYCYFLYTKNINDRKFKYLHIFSLVLLFYIHFLVAFITYFCITLHDIIKNYKKYKFKYFIIKHISVIVLALPILLYLVVPLLTYNSHILSATHNTPRAGSFAIISSLLGGLYSLFLGGIIYPWHFWIIVPNIILAVTLLFILIKKIKNYTKLDFYILILLPFLMLVVLVPIITPIVDSFVVIFRVIASPILLYLFILSCVFLIKNNYLRNIITIIIAVSNIYVFYVHVFNMPSLSQSPPLKEIGQWMTIRNSANKACCISPYYHGFAGEPISRYLNTIHSFSYTPDKNIEFLDVEMISQSLIQEKYNDVFLIQSNRFYNKANLFKDFLINHKYHLIKAEHFWKQADFDMMIKDKLKSIKLLNLNPEKSHKYILTVFHFEKRK